MARVHRLANFQTKPIDGKPLFSAVVVSFYNDGRAELDISVRGNWAGRIVVDESQLMELLNRITTRQTEVTFGGQEQDKKMVAKYVAWERAR